MAEQMDIVDPVNIPTIPVARTRSPLVWQSHRQDWNRRNRSLNVFVTKIRIQPCIRTDVEQLVANNSEPTFVGSLLSQLIRVKTALQQSWLVFNKTRHNNYRGGMPSADGITAAFLHKILKKINGTPIHIDIDNAQEKQAKNVASRPSTSGDGQHGHAGMVVTPARDVLV